MVTITIEEREFIETTINQCRECFVGMIDADGLPYVIPMNFGYKDDIIFMHSAPQGSAIKFLENNPNVCVTFCTDNKLTYQDEKVACSYRIQGSSVICKGKVEFIEDYDAKVEALNILMKQYTAMPFKYSEPSVRNVKIWKVSIEKVSGKKFGVPYKESHTYNQ